MVRAAAEFLPFAEDSFDLAVSEYGAAIWADPYKWIPEVARVLRPGAELVFLGNSVLLMLCAEDDEEPASAQLLRPQFGLHRIDWTEPECTEFHLSHGDWIQLLRGERLRDPGAVGAAAARGSDHPVFVRLIGVGPPVAMRGGLEGTTGGRLIGGSAPSIWPGAAPDGQVRLAYRVSVGGSDRLPNLRVRPNPTKGAQCQHPT